jgi:hypothetical protein
MIGFKYTNIKIQTAYIKFLMYSYLYNIFLVNPSFYYQFILTEFSKESLTGENSKEEFDKFINDNKELVDYFYKVIEKIEKDSNKIKKYMWLTCVLNKDMKTNFNLLSDAEIEKIGKEEITNLLFDTFFIVLDDIKNKHDFKLEDIKQKIYNDIGTDTKKKKSQKVFPKFGGSLQNLVDSCFFIENVENVHNFINRPIFTSINNRFESQKDKEDAYKGTKEALPTLKYGDMPSQIQDSLNGNYQVYPHPYNDYTKNIKPNPKDLLNETVAKVGYNLLETDLKNIVEDIGYKGFVGQVFFKIKDQVDVQFRCGSEASKNPITLSFRNSENEEDNRNHDFIYVQKFFNWKIDKTYLDLEQFIFVRQSEINDILKYDQINNRGTINLTKGFDESKQIGIKFIEGNDIYTLESKLLKSVNDSGFLALVPIKRANGDLIDELLYDSELKLYIGVFSDSQRNLRMSYGDLTRLICNNYTAKLKFEDVQVNPPTLMPEKDETLVPKTLSNINLGGRNLELDDLVDCYFSVYLNNFIIKEIDTNYTTAGDSFDPYIEKSAQTAIAVKTVFGLSLDSEEKIVNKEGYYSILIPKVIQPFLLKWVNKDLFLQVEKKFISSVKIKSKNKRVFKDFKTFLINYGITEESIFSTEIYDLERLKDPQKFFVITGEELFLEYLRKNFANEIIESFKKDTSEEEKKILEGLYPGINNPQNNLIMKLETKEKFKNVVKSYEDSIYKDIRSYKNVIDFLKYYKNSVENLAKELQDNV